MVLGAWSSNKKRSDMERNYIRNNLASKYFSFAKILAKILVKVLAKILEKEKYL